ncbi:MAG: chemotaxis protein CheX [Vicinamibacterales bacterium]
MSIPDVLLTELIAATEEVFARMVFMPVTVGTADAQVSPDPSRHVVATVAFAGHRSGFVSFHSSIDTARLIAGSMLGIPKERVNGEMPDAIGEIASMIAGSLRTKRAAHEPAWTLTCPSVTVGHDFSTVYPREVSDARVAFTMSEGTAEVELILSRR